MSDAQADERMASTLSTTLRHLRALVSFDTRNPPRAIGTGGIFDYIKAQLSGFRHELIDHGAGAVSLFCVRGKPRFLFNVHLDTVPAASTWTRDPLDLLVTGERAIGLGSCDIKGAAAALLTAAGCSGGDAAFLFSTDEEANDARCIAAYLQRYPATAGSLDGSQESAAPVSAARFDAVLVAEPTACEAVLAHRGITSVQLRFKGHSGHASSADAVAGSAVHQAMRWGVRALEFVNSQQHHRFGGMTGLRFNIGRVEGGIKANMIAASTDVRFGFRPLPSMNPAQLHDRFLNLVDPTALDSYTETFSGPSLPAGDTAAAETRRLAARDVADELGLSIGNAVDFWTEASLFSAAGYTAIVFGPGDIAQAHSADEWVSLKHLQTYTEAVIRILEHGR